MARARNIKPGFFTNDILVELPYEYRLLFIGLWTIADREGRLIDRPKKIKMEIFPADHVDCDDGLDMLNKSGFITRYEAAGEHYIAINAWAKHQNPHVKEAKSTIPAPGSKPAHNVEAPVEHGAGIVQAPDQQYAEPVQASEIPERAVLIPDSGFSDSLSTDSGLLPPEECAEPQSDSPPKAKPLRASFDYDTGRFENLSEQILEAWAQAYPAIDVRQEIAKARAWMLANPKNRKSNIERFLTSWMTKTQDRAPSHGQPNQNFAAAGRSGAPNRPLSAADRVRANNARERAAEIAAASGSYSPAVGADGGDVRAQVDQSIRGRDGSGERMGCVLEGTYERAG